MSDTQLTARTVVATPTGHGVLTRQRQNNEPLITNQNVPDTTLFVGRIEMPPGTRALWHVHPAPLRDLVVILFSGAAGTLSGPGLEWHEMQVGEVTFIPAGDAHAAINLDPDRPVVAYQIGGWGLCTSTDAGDTELLPDPALADTTDIPMEWREPYTEAAQRFEERVLEIAGYRPHLIGGAAT